MPREHDPRTEPVFDPAATAADLHPHLARLRREAPVAWNGDHRCWVLTRYADVVAVSSDPARFCSSRGILVEEIGRTYATPPTMMHTDPPQHTRYRRLVLPPFRVGAVGALEPGVRRRVADAVASLPPTGTVDLVPALAVPLPIRVIADVLGLPDDRLGDIEAWSDAAIPGAGDLTDDERMVVMGEMTVALLELAAARRRSPAADVTSHLAAVEVDGERLSDEELGMFLVQLLVAGNETTRQAMAVGLHALAERPDAWQQLRADRSLVPTAVEELLRWSTPVTSFLRTATGDAVVGGTPVAAGDPLLLHYASANRDEDEFGPTASSVVVDRAPNHHVAFGFGPHFCLGAHLARLELRLVLDAMLDRYATITPSGPAVRTSSTVIGGLVSAPLHVAEGNGEHAG